MEAMKTDDAVDYQRFYQQQSDVCMLRLFDSFLESAPQLVFHLYVMMHRKEEWSPQQAAWTALSAIISMVRKAFWLDQKSVLHVGVKMCVMKIVFSLFTRCLWAGESPPTARPCAWFARRRET